MVLKFQKGEPSPQPSLTMGRLTCTKNCPRHLSEHVIRRNYNAGSDFVGPIFKALFKSSTLTSKNRVQIQHIGVWTDTIAKYAFEHNSLMDQNEPLLGYLGVPQGSHRLQ